MTKQGLFFLLGPFLLFLQAHQFLPFGRTGVRPDLLLVFVTFLGLRLPVCQGALFCFVYGYGFDVLSGAHSGLYSLTYLYVFVFIKLLLKYFDFDTLVKRLGLFCLCIMIKNMIFLFSFYFIYEYGYFDVKGVFVKETITTVVLFPFLAVLFEQLFVLTGGYRGRPALRSELQDMK